MAPQHLLVFGLGYSATAIADAALAAGWAVTGTYRTLGRASGAVQAAPGVGLVAFADAGPALRTATHILSSVPPGPDGDPVLRRYAADIAAAPAAWLGYLSTTGVYGDHGGAWVDETTPPDPSSERARRRIAAEAAWQDVAGPRPLDVFRLAGIYGPGRSALDDLRAGTARRVIRPGHLFGRIHRDDIAAAVLAALRQTLDQTVAQTVAQTVDKTVTRARPGGTRVLNLADDEPAESAIVTAEAARLLGVPPPPAIPFDQALPGMSPMARSFWADDRKVGSQATQAQLGLRWRYPTYREGLRAILAQKG